MNRILILLLTLTVCYSCSEPPVPEAGVPLTLAEERHSRISDLRYDLRFVIPADTAAPVMGEETLHFHMEKKADLVLDFKASTESIKEVRANGDDCRFVYKNEHIVIPAAELKEGSNTVEIRFVAGNAALNRNADYMYALFVPDRARTAFPCLDQPDMKAVFTVALSIPENWKAMTNGPLKSIEKSDSLIWWKFAPSEKISTYLFSFTAGNYFSETRMVDGREMEFFHRETDSAKLAASIDEIFSIHAASLKFLEEYTGIPYPFRKFAFTAIPAFQFGGMEHPGAVWYNAGSLFLEKSATKTQLIRRANLIAHETAHMWFGDLVTMKWFNDVWMKEVFANFMADKIVAEILSDDQPDVKFITQHYPLAYAIDRTTGANPIRQELANLDQAGTMYGGIIYHKAPVVMQQLERIMGEKPFQNGVRKYLRNYAFANASWPDLIAILDEETDQDLKSWNDKWVNKPGRPSFDFPITDLKANTYGLFTADTTAAVPSDPVARTLYWLNLYENMLEGRYYTPMEYAQKLLDGLEREKEELIVTMQLRQLSSVYWRFLTERQRQDFAPTVEARLWKLLERSNPSNVRKTLLKSFNEMALSVGAMEKLYAIWKMQMPPAGISLSEDDYTDIASALALRSHPAADSILDVQSQRITNGDRKERFHFLRPSLSADQQVRDEFFESLKRRENRRKEAWVGDALAHLHHPLRRGASEKYLLPSLEMLEEIQTTGDIFFPVNWLEQSLGMYSSASANKIVNDFLTAHPNYNGLLKNKILQAADNLFRAQKLLAGN